MLGKKIDRMSGFSLSDKVNYPVVNNIDITPGKVLIVDDNPLSRMTAVDLLSLDGYEVLETDGQATIFESIRAEKPDLILLDGMMRQLDSFEVCKRIKEDRSTADIPIILTTLSDSREYRLKVMESGGDDFLVKPLDRIELSNRIKSLIDRKRLNESLDRAEQVIVSIAEVLATRSSNSNNGSARLASLAKEFGVYLELSPEAIDNLVFASRLHDIGTVAIPDAVILKKAELTPEETELIREHVLVGEKICQPLINRRQVLPIIRHHHERWDGTGYPDGLAGADIPYLAQIFQIMDIYDALTSDRPHKKAYTPAEALAIIAEETAKGWRNPEIVELFTTFIKARV